MPHGLSDVGSLPGTRPSQCREKSARRSREGRAVRGPEGLAIRNVRPAEIIRAPATPVPTIARRPLPSPARLRAPRLAEQLKKSRIVLGKAQNCGTAARRPLSRSANCSKHQFPDSAAILRSCISPALEVTRDNHVGRRAVRSGRRDHFIQDFDRRLQARGRCHSLASRIVGRLARDRRRHAHGFRTGRHS